jgi:alpha-beta hydrolase superfamily lysophospholipase
VTLRSVVLLLAGLLLTACAPTLQRPATPEPGFAGPRLEDHAFIASDGTRRALTRWDAAGGQPSAIIVGVHGMNDYANAFHLAAPWWAARGVTTYAYDQRGFGRSPRRGIWAPDSLRIDDLRTLVALVRRAHPGVPVAVVGESLGGAVAIEAFASDNPPNADRLILDAPAVWGWTSQPVLNRTLLWLAEGIAPGHVFVPPSWLTSKIAASDNRDELIAMGRDPLMIWGARTDALYGLVTTMQHAQRQIGALRVPTLYQYGAHDEIIPPSATANAVRRLPPSDRTAWYADGWHLLLRDRHAPLVWADALSFIRDPAAPLPSGAPGLSQSLARRRGRHPSPTPASPAP